MAVKTIKEDGERKKVFYTFSAENVVDGKEINFSTKKKKFAKKIIKLSLKEPVVLQGSETEPLLNANGASEFYVISGYLKSSEYKSRYEKKKAVKDVGKVLTPPIKSDQGVIPTPPKLNAEGCPEGQKKLFNDKTKQWYCG